MEYPSECKSEWCIYMCCDINGNCPSASSQCVYYYNYHRMGYLSPGAIAGIVIGSVCLFLILSLVVFFLLRRWIRSRNPQIINNPPPPLNANEIQRVENRNNLILAQNRQTSHAISSNAPSITQNLQQPYFQPNQINNNPNLYYNS